MSADADDARIGGDADTGDGGDGRTFLGRWSARKRGVAARERGDRNASAGTVDEAADDARGAIVPGTAPGPSGADAGERSYVAPSSDDPTSETVESGDGLSPTDAASSTSGSDLEPTPADAEPVLTDADMPPIESLRADSDVSGFFSSGVSATLRRAALRHVFSLPAYNVRDGLNDYDGDYTVFEPLGDVVTSDMKFHTARLERKRLEEERLAEERLEEERVAGESGDDEQLADERLAEETLEDERPAGARPEDERLDEARLEDGRPEEERLAEGRPAEERLDEERSTGMPSEGERSAEGTSRGESDVRTDARAKAATDAAENAGAAPETGADLAARPATSEVPDERSGRAGQETPTHG